MVHPLQTNKRTGQVLGYEVTPVSVPSHSALTDLAVGDDHPQYVRTDGTRAGWPVPSPTATDLSYDAATRVIASSTGTDATLPLVSSADAGLAPASGGGTAKFLRADNAWAVPAISVFSSSVDGSVPASGGGTTKFLRADGSWAVPSGGGGSGLDQAQVLSRVSFGSF
jgi:hypothetical protein